MNLPDLKKYRADFIEKGVVLPLPVIAAGQGMLNLLPSTARTGWPWTEQTDPSIYNTRGAWPKLSIITPSYQQGKFLEETIRSVLLQNYPNLEFVVMDGGSTDETKAILEKYDRWISHRQSEKDNGQAQAINMGFSLASGDYFAWINSDDCYLKNTFHKIISAFFNTGAKFIYGYGLNHYVEENRFETVKVLPLLDYFIKIPGLVQPSTFWSAEIHQPLWEELHCALDFELWLRLLKGQKRKLLREPLSVAKVHDDAKTHDPKMQARWHADHLKIWAEDAHGEVKEWKRITFLNRIRVKFYKFFNMI